MLVRKQDLIQLVLAGAMISCLFLTLWVGGRAVLGVLAFGLLFLALHLNATLRATRYNLLLFLYPAWAGITVLWADYPMSAIRLDIQLFLTVFIFMSITCIASLKHLLEILCGFYALTLMTVLFSSQTVEIFYTGEIVRVGVLGSKNNVSGVGAAALTSGTMLLASPQRSARSIVLALAAITVAAASIIQAKSLGTFLTVLLCGAFGVLIWNMKTLIRHASLRSLIIYGVLIAVIALGVIIFIMSTYEGYVSLMQSLGKDPTITGRTFIWSIGLGVIEDNFWGGVGLNSFWSERNANAVLIWVSGSREVGSPYGFHNLYIHTWVETGLPGFLIMTAIILTMVIRIIEFAKSGCTAQEATAVAFALFVVIKSFFEVPIFNVFSINTFFFFLIWVVLNRSSSVRMKPMSQCQQ